MKSTKIKILGTLISLVLFGWILSKQNLKDLWHTIIDLPTWVFLCALALFILAQIFNGWRWYILLKGQKINVSFTQVVGITFGGAFASNFLPSTVGGDFFRILAIRWLAPPHKKNIASISVGLDRAINLTNRICFVPSIPFAFSLNLSQLPFASMAFLGGNFNIKHKIEQFLHALKAWKGHRKDLVFSFIVATFSNLAPITAVWVLAKGLKMPVSYIEVVGASTIIYLITLVPISINGYGLKEGLYIAVYSLLGATPTQSISLALLARTFLLLSSLPGTFTFFSFKHTNSPSHNNADTF